MTASAMLVALAAGAMGIPQEIPPSRFDDARLASASILQTDLDAAPVNPLGFGLELPATEPEDEEGWLTWKRIAHRLGGVVVGGWLGFVSAQVILSDWDKETNGSFRDQRYSWAAGGAVAGLLGSFLVGGTRAPRPSRAVVVQEPRDDSYIDTEEIRESQARTAFELIYNTRMQWLITRGVNSVAESPKGQAYSEWRVHITPGRDKIIVYMDNVHIGGIDVMRDISTDVLTSARFLDGRQATQRFGGGHAHGVILLSTAVTP